MLYEYHYTVHMKSIYIFQKIFSLILTDNVEVFLFIGERLKRQYEWYRCLSLVYLLLLSVVLPNNDI